MNKYKIYNRSSQYIATFIVPENINFVPMFITYKTQIFRLTVEYGGSEPYYKELCDHLTVSDNWIMTDTSEEIKKIDQAFKKLKMA